MPAPLALLEGSKHRLTLGNDAYKRVSGGGRDVPGLTPAAAFPELAGTGIFALHDRVDATGEPWAAPETLVRYDRDGTGVQDTWFDLRFEPVRDGGGRVVGFLHFAVDVTDQVRARREVERLLAGSEAANAQLADANARLQAQGAELAAQAEALQATAAELEERTEAADRARAEADDARRAAEHAAGSRPAGADGYCSRPRMGAGGHRPNLRRPCAPPRAARGAGA